jgi:Mn-dependent DtxR family transcriptional regulator
MVQARLPSVELKRHKKLREDFLVTLWEMHDGNYGGDRPTRELCKKIGADYDSECSSVGQHLRGEGLVIWSGFDWISLTIDGRREAERIVESRYAEKETRVLKAIYELSGQNTTKIVGFHEMVPTVGMSDREVSGICKGLEERGFIYWPDGDFVTITRAGIQAIDSLGQPPPKGGDTYNLHIGTAHGPIQQGSGNTQNIQLNVTNNPDFDQAIQSLLQLIGSSSLPVKDEIQEQVVQVNKLALQEPSTGLLEKAKFRLSMIEVGLKGTDLLIKAGPYLAIASEYFRRKYGG